MGLHTTGMGIAQVVSLHGCDGRATDTCNAIDRILCDGRETGIPCITGADFKVPPGDLAQSLRATHPAYRVIRPAESTCQTYKKRTTIDYFFLHQDLAAIVRSCNVEDTSLATHRPVSIEIDLA